MRAVAALEKQFAPLFRPCNYRVEAGIFPNGLSVVFKPPHGMRPFSERPAFFLAQGPFEPPAHQVSGLFNPQIPMGSRVIVMPLEHEAP